MPKKQYKKEEINDDFILKMYILPNGKISINNIRQSFFNNHPEIKEYLENRYTPFINYSTVIRCIQNNFKELPRCKICGNFVPWGQNYCSSFCKTNDKELQLTASQKQSLTKKMWSQERKQQWLDKVKLTIENRSEERKQEIHEHRVDGYKKGEEKRKKSYKETCMLKYGVEAFTQSDIFKSKCKDTYQSKFQVDYYTQTDEFKEKSIQSTFEKTGYNTIGYANPIINKKSKNTCKERYGVDNAMKSNVVREKVQSTCLNKYGVRSYSQTKEFKEKLASLRYIYEGLSFDSSWELAFYIYHKDYNIDIEREPICISYMFKNKEHKYFPDFRINGIDLIEIKNPNSFDENGKMIDLYNHRDDLCEAKHQCMISNKVKIITDVSEYLNYIRKTYGTNYLKSFKVCKEEDNL